MRKLLALSWPQDPNQLQDYSAKRVLNRSITSPHSQGALAVQERSTISAAPLVALPSILAATAIEDIFQIEIGKETAYMYMMRFCISLYGFMNYAKQ